MNRYRPYLNWIESQRDRMMDLTMRWAGINSGTHNLEGIERLSESVAAEFQTLGVETQRISLPPHQFIDSTGHKASRPLARMLRFAKRTDAPVRALLVIHLDTVYGPDHPFQKVWRENDQLRGPGVADAKGGLVVMLTALQAIEKSDVSDNLDWEILLNTDEEIGSPASAPLLREAAKNNHLGLLFEPAMADGSIVSTRKGSGTFTVIVRGRAAHVGRNPELGRNAIHALAEIIGQIRSLNDLLPGVVASVGQIEGGGPTNIVPDLAIGRCNIRVETLERQQQVEQWLQELVNRYNQREGLRVEIHGGFLSPPKLPDEPAMRLLNHVIDCGREIGIDIGLRHSGGVCDGNKLAAAGLPNVDTLGVRGGNLHSPDEYMIIDSLVERAQLAALLLMKLASGEIAWRATP